MRCWVQLQSRVARFESNPADHLHLRGDLVADLFLRDRVPPVLLTTPDAVPFRRTYENLRIGFQSASCFIEVCLIEIRAYVLSTGSTRRTDGDNLSQVLRCI